MPNSPKTTKDFCATGNIVQRAKEAEKKKDSSLEEDKPWITGSFRA